ncbi:MAG: helicase-exonuclease AddAB subunit AddA [Lawsonibacter sp.]|jgi:ATP-dependent helicase/nuclease subunit A
MGFPLTEEQRGIVEDRKGELLVSAAAGSGKTRVLVERLLNRVVEEALDIDDFLVITYTKAAAAELRGRIAQELASRLAQDPNHRHLRRQTTLVYKAQISTIHAFCAAFLRECGHLLDLDPDFRLCDEGEAQILMTRTLEAVLDRCYEDLDPEGPFAQLVDTLAAGRDDSRLIQIVLDIFTRVQSHPNPVHWLEEQKKMWDLEGVSDLGQTIWGRLLMEQAKRQGRWCRERLAAALTWTEADELLEQNYAPSISETLSALESLIHSETWDEANACLPIPFPPVGRKKKRTLVQSPMEEERGIQATERVKAVRTRCKKQLEKIQRFIEGESAERLEELELVRPVVQALMDLVVTFYKTYAAEKKKRGLIDFSDLEHFSVALLCEEDGSSTPLAEHWSARYAEVMVDEYQDTNQVQNAIFSAISQRGNKLFQVGDVKQSIYRFRLADPTIFLEKYQRFPMWDQATPGQAHKRVLSCNFRSRPEVLLGCNDLFGSIMSNEFGEIDYTKDQELVPKAQFPHGEGNELELNLLDLSCLGDQEGEKVSKELLEARFAAREIRAMLEQPKQIADKGEMRPVRPSDIMILLRSPGSVLPYYLQALEEEGIPWAADGSGAFLDTTEVHVALSILQLVDNPRQDVPLLAAMRSPVYGFTADELALLRSRATGDFYSAVRLGAENGDKKCQSFLGQLSQLRLGMGDCTCRQLIWRVYEQTNLLGIFGAMDSGQERQDNLLALYALAGQLENSGCRTLFQFLLRLRRMEELGEKLVSNPPKTGEEGVRILSIHRSKGLECPVVLVCGLSRRLNRDDLMRPVLFHPTLGVGPKGLDRKRMIEYPTVARHAVERQLEREMMAEELRLLYVAMTRAQEKLILNITLTEGVRTLERLGEDMSIPVSPLALESQQSVGQWILLHALTRPEAKKLREMAHLPELIKEDVGPAWKIDFVDGATLCTPSDNQKEWVGASPQVMPKQEIECIVRQLEWKYPYWACTNLPSKLTATQIKGRLLDQEVAQEGGHSPLERILPSVPLERPNFMVQKQGLTTAQQGTALHLAMQYLPLEGDHSSDSIQLELKKLQEKGFLSELQQKSIHPELLSAFFQSKLGQEMLQAKECKREFKLSILVPASEYFPQAGPGENVLLQGVVDAWFGDESGVTVLDFKSDRVVPGMEWERAMQYRPQLQAYSRALSAILGRPVKRNVLWFFATGTAVELT